jgi:hypothetical protein
METKYNKFRRFHLPYGFKNVYGTTLPSITIDRYNRVQDSINAYTDAGRRVPEYLLWESFNIIAILDLG